MTEAEWLTATDPAPMLSFLEGKTSNRKLRLFAVACCRRIWHIMTDPKSRYAVEVAELYADRLISDNERSAARNVEGVWAEAKLAAARNGNYLKPVMSCAWHSSTHVGSVTLKPAQEGSDAYWAAVQSEKMAQCGLVQDISGNPFRSVSVDPSWLTSDVSTLAEGIYQDRAFDRMPILADALQDAGCDNNDILSHCRSDAQHVRGCWVVDLLTGRK